MKQCYFAASDGVLENGFFEVAVFNTERERDEWVNFEDYGSLSNGETKEDNLLGRIPIDGIEAETCQRILSECNIREDPLNDNMFWIT